MTKLYILQEIKRTTEANGGRPLDRMAFEAKTGITRFEWFGVYWARWSDAVREASGLQLRARPSPRQPIRRSFYHSTRARTSASVARA